MLIETVLLASVASLGASVSAASLPVAAFPVVTLPVAAFPVVTLPVAGRAGAFQMAYLLAARAPWRALQLAPALTPDCARLRGELLLPCTPTASGPDIDEELPGSDYEPEEVRLPSVSREMGGTLGGFRDVDVLESPHLRVGPMLSWLTPDSPREDLLRLRVVAPGWGIRYSWETWDEGVVSVGIAACTRFVMFGEDFPVVDVLTSEARVEFSLP